MPTFKILGSSLIITSFILLFNGVDYLDVPNLYIVLLQDLFLILAIFNSLKLVKNIIVESAKSQLNEITELVEYKFDNYNSNLANNITYLERYIDSSRKILLKHMDVNNDSNIKVILECDKQYKVYNDHTREEIIKQLTNQNLNYKLTNDLLKSFIVDMDKNQSDYLVSVINNKVEYITKVISTTQEGVLDSIETHDKDLQLYIAKSISKLADATYIVNNMSTLRNDINNATNIAKLEIVNHISDDNASVIHDIVSSLKSKAKSPKLKPSDIQKSC